MVQIIDEEEAVGCGEAEAERELEEEQVEDRVDAERSREMRVSIISFRDV